jgi:CHASE2 domain-containing sensor protein/signal transduction histidine kinase
LTNRARWLDDLAVACTLAAVAAACAFTGLTWRLDRLVYDQALSWWTLPAPPDVVIVAIDDASIQAIGRWPWPRAVHATLLERLAEARPRAVALDLLLSEPDPDPHQDALLAKAMARAAPVVMPIAWHTNELRGLQPLAPIDELRPWARLGAVDSSVDLDGVLRHGFLRAGPTGHLWPNLAAALLEAGGETPHPTLWMTFDAAAAVTTPGWQRDGRFPVRFAGPAGTIRTLSYADVLSGRVSREDLAGHYVLIGATAQGLGDRQPTPVDGGGSSMGGIEVLANQVSSLRSDQQLVELDAPQVAAVSVSLLVLLVAGMTRVGAGHALALALAAVPAAIATSFALLAFGPWVAPMPFAVAALLAYPMWSWRRLERAMAGIDRGIDALGADMRRPAAGDAVTTRLRVLRDAADLVRESRRFLAEALAAQPTAMLVADAGQRVLLANARAAALFEVAEAEDLVGLDLGRLLQELSTPGQLQWTQVLDALPRSGFATEASLGDSTHLMLHLAVLDQPGGRRYVVTLADIGPVRAAERAREEALGFVSHDLRGPTGAIVLLADLNLQGAVSTPREELLRQVRELASRALALADAFVRASRAGSQPLQRSHVGLQELIEEALVDVQPAAKARDIRFDLNTEATTVHVDRFLMARAIGNLVSNAVRHSPVAGSVGIQAAVAAGRARLRVSDCGPGLTPQQMAQIESNDTGAAVGTAQGVGLGLVFVQRVARRHGGALRVVASAPGSRTTFEIDIQA